MTALRLMSAVEVSFCRRLKADRGGWLPLPASKLPPCLIGMEACGTSHHWARALTELGHEVRLMPPAYVKPYVKRGKNDAVTRKRFAKR